MEFYNQLTMDYMYLLLGLLIILLALAFSKRLGDYPVILNVQKIGLNLNADRLTLFYLLGFLVIGVGVFFKFKGYETRLLNLEKDLKIRETVEAQLSIFKEYEFDVILDFDSTFNISPQDKDVRYFIDKSKGGKILQNQISPSFGDVAGVFVHIDHIKLGDKLRIIAMRKNEEQWVSEEIEVPKSKIKLTRLK